MGAKGVPGEPFSATTTSFPPQGETLMNPVLVSTRAEIDFAALRSAIAGDVIARGDDAYDEARLAWNLAVDQRPAAVVLAESAIDVVKTVRFAASTGLRIAPQ